MTPEYGFGMLAMGLVAILIGAIVAYFIIKKIHNENDTNNLVCYCWVTGCSAKFDSYDPTTAMFRWILTNEKK